MQRPGRGGVRRDPDSDTVSDARCVSGSDAHCVSGSDADADTDTGTRKRDVVDQCDLVPRNGRRERADRDREPIGLRRSVHGHDAGCRAAEFVQRHRDHRADDEFFELHDHTGGPWALHLHDHRRKWPDDDLDDRRYDDDGRRPEQTENAMISRASSTRATVLALIAALTAGCAGGGTTTPVTAQSPSKKTALVQFQIVVRSSSSTARRPAYISPSTKSASSAVTPSGGSAGTPTIVNCTTVCSAQVLAPVGSDTFTVNLYDGTNAGGNLLSTGTLTQTIAIDQANTVSVTFNGVVVSLSVVLNPSTVTVGTSTTVAVSANAVEGHTDR